MIEITSVLGFGYSLQPQNTEVYWLWIKYPTCCIIEIERIQAWLLVA